MPNPTLNDPQSILNAGNEVGEIPVEISYRIIELFSDGLSQVCAARVHVAARQKSVFQILAEFFPCGHRVCQVLAGVAANSVALKSNRPAIAELLQRFEKFAHVERTLI